MTRWRPAVADYLRLRQTLGCTLSEARRALQAFAAFLDQRRAAHLTSALALEWAQANPAVRPAEWARRSVSSGGLPGTGVRRTRTPRSRRGDCFPTGRGGPGPTCTRTRRCAGCSPPRSSSRRPTASAGPPPTRSSGCWR